MEFLKDVFGDKALTFDELQQALKDNDKIKLANLASGEYVSKEKLMQESLKVKNLNEQLETANKKLEGYDPDWKQTAENAKIKAQGEIDALKKDFAVDRELLQAGAKNLKAVKALLDLDTIKLDGEKIIGLKEQFEKIQQENDYLFNQPKNKEGQVEEEYQPYHYKPAGGGESPPNVKSFVEIIKENQVKRD